MSFRGYFALNNVEFANSSRVVAHLGRETPVSDEQIFLSNAETYQLTEVPAESGLYDPSHPRVGAEDEGLYDPGTLYGSDGFYYVSWDGTDCSLTRVDDLLFDVPDAAVEYTDKLYRPPNGSRRFGPGLYSVGDCWNIAAICGGCSLNVLWDDSWPGLAGFLGHGEYRPELAPWYVSEIPESGEFAGVWVMDVQGLDTARIERAVTETVGDGGVAAPHRDATRTIRFEALLLGCSNAGVQYGLNWLTCLLRNTNDNVTTKLRYLNAHPGVDRGEAFPMTFPFRFSLDPSSLVREMNGIVLTTAPEITDKFVTGGAGPNRQANIYRVTWELTALNPHAYLPEVDMDVDWDRITRQPINWIHAADCNAVETCEAMPVMFSTECVPEEITVVNTPPPVCGGCLPVSAIDKYQFNVPTQDYAFRCRETAVSMVVTNTGEDPLTLQGFWRVCDADVRCDDNLWPVQIAGLPAGAELHLDGISGRYWAWYDERVRRPVGVVGTPNGAPWRPPVIDRETCWDFIVQTASTSEFTVSMTLADRGP